MVKRRLTAMHLVVALVLLPLLAVNSGCSKDPYTACMSVSLDIENGIGDAVTIIAQLKADNLVTQNEVVMYANYLSNLSTLNGTFRTSVRAIKKSATGTKADYLNAATILVTNANNPQVLAALHVSNPQAQAKVSTVMNAIKTAIDGIQTAINKAKGV